MITKLLKPSAHVQPNGDGKWDVMKYNAFEGLWVDLRRWGIRTALYNFVQEVGLATGLIKPKPLSDSDFHVVP